MIAKNIAKYTSDLLRSEFKQSEYINLIIPFVLISRLRHSKRFKQMALEPLYERGEKEIKSNLLEYIKQSPESIKDILEKLKFEESINKLDNRNLLWNMFDYFYGVNLSPRNVDPLELGDLFQEILRQFSEMSHETSGEHYTPKDVVTLVAELILSKEDKNSRGIRTIYDPTCGTGGMLWEMKRVMAEKTPHLTPLLFGQELNAESCALARAEIILSGENHE